MTGYRLLILLDLPDSFQNGVGTTQFSCSSFKQDVWSDVFEEEEDYGTCTQWEYRPIYRLYRSLSTIPEQIPLMVNTD